MTTIGATDYVYLGDIATCGGGFTYDNTDYGTHGFGGLDDDVIIFFQVWLEHKQTMQFDLHVRIHQPTVNFNNNTQAIWTSTFFGINLDSTAEGDHGDRNLDRSTTYKNYGPSRWLNVEFSNVFGSVEWTWQTGPCTYVDDPPGHSSSLTVPRIRSRGGAGGGWAVGQA